MVCSGRSLQRPTRTNRRRRTDEKRRPEGLKARIAKRRPTQPLRVWQVLLAEIPTRAAAPAKLSLSTTFAKARMLSKRSTEPSIIAQHRIVYSMDKILSKVRAGSTLSSGGNARRCHMLTLCKSTVLSVGLFVGVAATAHAQSVSALPPGGAPAETQTHAQTARSPVFGSTQSFFPKPGGGALIKEEHYQPQADWNANNAAYPSATGWGRPWGGPKPN